jgi:hypothetical protein
MSPAANKETETMARKFEPNNLVHLPYLDALATQSLGSAVLAAAADKTLPGPIDDAVAQLKVAVDRMKAAAMDRIPNGDPAARAADIKLDAAWSALHGLLIGWSRLPDHPRAELAATLLKVLFPDGLRFTRLPFRLEWVESTNRLGMIDERGFAQQIEQFGAADMLTQIRQAHAHYGEVLSISTAHPPVPGVGIREARTAVMKALRLLVVRVQGAVTLQDPASADLARDLLAPIETWEHTAAVKPANDHVPTPAPTPAPPVAVVTPAPVKTPAAATGDGAAGAGDDAVAGATKRAG